MRNLLKLNYIQEFVTVAKTRSFSKAANLLFTTQPVLSRHIAAIEEELGVKLLVRDTRKVALSPIGQSVYVAFSEMLRQYELACSQAKLYASGLTGTVKISCPYYMTADFLEPVIEAFSVEYPDIQAEIQPGLPYPCMCSMITGETDIAINYMAGIQVEENIRYVEFASERMAVALPSGSPYVGHSELHLSELKTDVLVMFNFSADSFDTDTEDILRKGGVHIVDTNLLALMPDLKLMNTEKVYITHPESLSMEIRKTGGLSIVPYCFRNMNRSYIHTIPIADEGTPMPLYMFYRLDNKNPAVPLFLRVAQKMWEK